MGDPDTAARPLIHIPPYGNFSTAPDASAPLLVVFGGIPVGPEHHKVQSGVYMWNYMNTIKDRFHIFVANDTFVNGHQAYQSLTSTLQAQGLTPSEQILYLFSGGYKPGMNLLPTTDPATFSSIFLVDIWIGSDKGTIKFYKGLADANGAKITYVYTMGAANNDKARDYIANTVRRATLVKVGGHMGTNTVAVRLLP